METIVLVIHIILAVSVVGIILIQPSEGGMGAMGGGNAFGGMTTARGGANLLTRITAILVALFIITSLTLAIMAGRKSVSDSVLEFLPEKAASQIEDIKETADKKIDIETPELPISQ